MNREWSIGRAAVSKVVIYTVRVFFHDIAMQPSGDWTTSPHGGPVERIRVIPPQSQPFIEIPDEVRNLLDQCDDQVTPRASSSPMRQGTDLDGDARGALQPMR